MYRCFHCGQETVIWDGDYDSDDLDMTEEDGLFHELHCTACGARITYFIPTKQEDEQDD